MNKKEEKKKEYEIEIEEKEEPKEMKLFKEITEWSFCIFIALFLALWTRYYIFTSTVVKQSSMYPTLKENQRVILNRTKRLNNGKYQRGDIVTFEKPANVKTIKDVDISTTIAKYKEGPKTLIDKFLYYNLEITKINYIKRVIGVEGDRVEIKNNAVYINGELLQEDYIQKNVITKEKYFNDVIVPKGMVYVLGDNRNNSTDSRTFGCIPLDKVEGKVTFRYLPFKDFGKIK